jgi:hopanoid biosynthesis associated RND transporter like protein HpnN
MDAIAPPPPSAFDRWLTPPAQRVADWCARNPWPTIAIAVLLTALGALAATGIKVNTNSADMLSPRLDFRERALAMKAAFPGLDERLVVVVRAPSADAADLFLARLVAEIGQRPRWLAEPFAAPVDPFFQHNGLLFTDDAELDATLARITRAAPLIAQLAADPSANAYFSALADGLRNADAIAGGEEALSAALDETAATIEARLAGRAAPLPWSRLFAGQDGATVQRSLTVEPKLDFGRLTPARPALDDLKAAVAAARADPRLAGVEAGVTGDPALRGEELASVTQGLWRSGVASVVAIALILWLAFASLRRALVAAGVVVVAVALTAGFAGLALPPLNLVSVAFAILMVGLGADYATHTLLRADEAKAAGATPRAAVAESMGELALPLALCAAATAVGFLAFIPTPFQGMAQLGMLGAFGVLVVFLASITLVPAGIALSGAPSPPRKLPRFTGGGLGARWRAPATRIVVTLALLSALALPFARFDADPMALRDPSAPSVRAFAWLFDDAASQPYRAAILAPSLAEADAVAARVKALPGVDSATTLSSLLPGEEALFRRDAIETTAFGVLPQLEPGAVDRALPGGMARLRAELAQQTDAPAQRLAAALDRLGGRPELQPAVEADLFAFWPMRLAQLKAQLQPDADITPDALPAPLRERFVNAAGEARVEIAPAADLRNDAARAAFVDMLAERAPEATGPVVTVERAGRVIGQSMLQAFITTLAVCALVLWLARRDVLMVAATLTPVLAASAATVAMGVLLGVPFNYANVVAMPLLVGAGVDSAIHYAARAGHTASLDAVEASSTPRAILFSALTTIASSGSLMLSPHRGVASIGVLLTVALTATVLATLVIQPAAIRAVERWRARVQPPASPLR